MKEIWLKKKKKRNEADDVVRCITKTSKRNGGGVEKSETPLSFHDINANTTLYNL